MRAGGSCVLLEKLPHVVLEWFRAAADFLFGYDSFISYAHKDGTQYPRLLRDRLEALGYRTFLDVYGYNGGDESARRPQAGSGDQGADGDPAGSEPALVARLRHGLDGERSALMTSPGSASAWWQGHRSPRPTCKNWPPDA